ncbi:SDR family NAD(P)-dependent oxidoreductase [Cronobacter dublinensis]|uniref:SDR family NAD(P)-dependent oxidoreductase n=1 Tax=Cronobacter dublinensis TaxID=413497 RepID=UPI0023DD0350|nr:SDR family NAD(P)-dependent oxidoreductase [Cronobacter dublinensis]MDT3666506.1 SDR family NAD(P)-dependent oxidoreductase [Cronobacter dublinensis]WEP46219.1 SDR family NAD(P)-dependent oxidoreductase [Cronobacter dublinensis]
MSEERMINTTIVITGASSGFGRGAALALAKRGANVVLAARRGEALEALAQEINAGGGHALAVETDVSQPDQVERLAQAAIARFGPINVWINNVGIGALGWFWEIPVADHERLVDVNLKGVIYGAHVAVKHFIAQGFGVLINTGSVDSEVPLAFQSSYAATKAAVLSLGRTINEELRLNDYNDIKVATIMPWAVDTPWWTHAANYTGHAPRMAAMDSPEKVIDAMVKACFKPEEEIPVGWKARSSNLSHHLFPDMTEKLSAKVINRSVEKAQPLAATTGAIYTPMADTTTIDGGIRARMKQEDNAR